MHRKAVPQQLSGCMGLDMLFSIPLEVRYGGQGQVSAENTCDVFIYMNPETELR